MNNTNTVEASFEYLYRNQISSPSINQAKLELPAPLTERWDWSGFNWDAWMLEIHEVY